MVQNNIRRVQLPEPAASEIISLDKIQDHVADQVFARLIHTQNISQFIRVGKYDNTYDET